MNDFFAGVHVVEVGDVTSIFGQYRFKRRLNRFMNKSVLVDAREPRMRKYILNAIFRSNSCIRFFGKTFVNEIFAVIRHGDSVFLGVWEEDGL